MKHTLQISVSKEMPEGGIVSCRHVTVREKLLRFLLGKRQRVTVIVPGDSVESLSINEVSKKGGRGDEQE